MDIVSIPLGITFDAKITSGETIIQPSLDLTVTYNTGNDAIGDNIRWEGVKDIVTPIQSEVLDSWTYGAKAGVMLKNGNFACGLDVNYTGSSNTESFGVNALVKWASNKDAG